MGQAVIPSRICGDTRFKIKLYRYGKEYKTLNVLAGTSVSPGTCEIENEGDTFYGWSSDPNSTELAYSANSVITPTGNMSLYAIFEYDHVTVISEETTLELTSPDDGSSSEMTINLTADQTIKLASRYSANGTFTW